ncbi:MAG: hypothetical protein GC161_18800 [Planctomycetaceae bacterium]|nr:hypothetical protein [Planctomycetaceae bacterium]
MRRVLRVVLLPLVGLLLGLVAAEWGVRTFAPQLRVTEHLEWESHPAVGFRLAPLRQVAGNDGGSINELGLRGPAVPPRRDGERRLLVLGDSFTFGAGVATEAAFPAQLGALLSSDSGATVVNGGTPSYGTERQSRWLNAFGDRVDPTHLVLAVFVGNDFTDNLELEGPVVFEGKLMERQLVGASTEELRGRLWLSQFHLWRLVSSRRTPAPARPEPTAKESKEAGQEAYEQWKRAEEQNFARRQGERIAIYAPPAREAPHIKIAYDAMEVCLARVKAWCDERGVHLAVAILPDVVQVEDNLQAQVAAFAGIPPGAAEWDRPQSAIRNWCATQSVPCVDLLPPFRKAGRAGGDDSLYLVADSHFNARGHLLAAEVLARELSEFWARPPG